MLLPELKRAKTRFTKLSKTRFISGLSAGIRERMLKPDICVYSVPKTLICTAWDAKSRQSPAVSPESPITEIGVRNRDF
jgi:hypothetical protein